MKINYQKILSKNMINVFKDVLLNIKKNGLQENQHLYITFETNNSKVKIPKWLNEKYKKEMTIIMQYEYWDFKIKDKYFNITLSFDNIKADLEISFDSVISFADPYSNFGLRLISDTPKKHIQNKKKIISKKNQTNQSNVIEFKDFKKN